MLRPQTTPSVNTGERFVQRPLVAHSDAALDYRTRASPAARIRSAVQQLDVAAHRWLVAHSIALLRLSLGFVFLAFGALKLFPGVSPAESLVKATMDALTFGLVPGALAVAIVGVLECVVGVWLIAGRALRGVIYLLASLLVGIMSPLVVLAPRLFDGPHHAPTLEGQYVIKDLILVAATLVLAATLRGGRLASGEDDAAS